jgi:Zn-dependent M28 family amino/carboxypeptidase
MSYQPTEVVAVRRLSMGILLALMACDGAADVGGSVSASDAPPLSPEEIAQHMRVLASDDFLGRGPGQRGGELAAEYIAADFEAAGLEAPNGSYFQAVPMIGAATDPSSVTLVFDGPSGSVAPTYLDDFVLNAGDPEAARAGGEAELIFVGYGISAPESDWDDFGGVDVAGKYVLILVNDPPAPDDEPDLFGGVAMTYYGRWTYKYEEAARQGALGALIVHETDPAGYPWSVVRGGFSGEQFALPADPGGTTPAALQGWVSVDVARRVLAAGGHDFDGLKERAARRGFTAVPTGIVVRASLENAVRRVDTRNVVGLLPGSTRPDEYITVTSHYDHFGVGEPIDGDSIYNGAYDNASGTALLLTLAGAMADMRIRPARSVLFIATAAEEQGLLGAQWYAQMPLFPLERTVAEVNVDGANLWGRTTDMIVQGEERSELGAFVRERAQELGVTLMPDAEPEKGFFFRSDHFPFAKAGVPSVYVEHGRRYVDRPDGWGDEIQADYTANNYHAPSDEFREEFVFDGAVQQGTLMLLTVLDIAEATAWPNWHEGQEFKAARDAMMEEH